MKQLPNCSKCEGQVGVSVGLPVWIDFGKGINGPLADVFLDLSEVDDDYFLTCECGTGATVTDEEADQIATMLDKVSEGRVTGLLRAYEP